VTVLDIGVNGVAQSNDEVIEEEEGVMATRAGEVGLLTCEELNDVEVTFG
jgi:hypothetical protein